MRPSLSWVSLALLLAAAPAWPLDPSLAITQYRLDVWNTEDGLPQSSVEAILQTHDGYLWLGTQEGLVRFDGVRFVVYDTANTRALRHNRVYALFEDKDRTLWLGTEAGGLARVRDGVFTAIGGRKGFAGGDSVRAITQDASGALWIGTAKGLVRLRGEEERKYTRADGLPGDSVRALAVARDGSLWVGTTDGLARVVEGKVERVRLTGAPKVAVLALWPDEDGTVWAGISGGLVRIRGDQMRTFRNRDGLPGRVQALWRDRDGSLWIGVEHGGLARLVGERFSRFSTGDGLANDMVLALREDREGNLWVGTQDGGLTRLAAGKFVAYTKREGLAGDIAWPVLEDREGSLWVGTNGGGLSRMREGTIRNFTTADGLSSNAVQSLAQDRQGALWIGTRGGGLDRYADGRFTNYTEPDLPGDSVSALLADRDGTLWVGTRGHGLARLRDGTFQRYGPADGLPDDTIHFIHQDRNGTVWLATDGGGLVQVRNDGTFHAYTMQDGLPTDIINTLYEDAQGTLWIGTYGGGLVRFRDGVFKPVSTAEGLFDNAIFHILEDASGHLWISCNKGVFRVSKQELNDLADGLIARVKSVAYGTEDGMKSRECNGANQPAGWRGADGRLWFPTIRGVVTVHPERLAVNRVPPLVAIEEITADKEVFGAEQDRQFRAGTEAFEFRYTAVSFSSPRRVRFRYRLEHLDRDWVDVDTRRVAYYTRIPPGQYRFLVQAINEDGVSSETAVLRFRLRPYFYTTPAFYLACCGVLLIAGVGGVRLKIRRARLREQALERQVEERTQQLEQANRTLARLSSLDGLTGVANRRAFDEAIEVEWRRAARTGGALALVLVDIDHFKAFNDTYGHQGGDACLGQVGSTLARSAARAGELVARYGGEEFVVLLPATTQEGAAALAETLRGRVEALAIPHTSSSAAAVVTLSVGVAAAVPADGGSPAGLLAAADRALYAAKRGGRNRVVVDGGAEQPPLEAAP